jgi:serine/threonine protein kinase
VSPGRTVTAIREQPGPLQLALRLQVPVVLGRPAVPAALGDTWRWQAGQAEATSRISLVFEAAALARTLRYLLPIRSQVGVRYERDSDPMDPRDPKREAASAESWTVPDGRGRPVSAATVHLFRPGTVLAERYELRRILGQGGMGVVFEAYDRVLGAAIAIKIVRQEYAGERAWAERLAREVKLARQINHPNVCRVFDVGQAEAHPFLTMELAPGGTLREEIASGRVDARPFEQRLSDATMIASGLGAIHAARIVHRDVAPQNVLRMGDGSLVLSDFGLATDRLHGSSSVHGGTVAYMAPEVVRGACSSTASDVWSLGVVIHECVFGVRPRWSDANKRLFPPNFTRRLSATEDLVFQVCRGCLSEDPRRRPKLATDVVHWLNRPGPGWRSSRPARALTATAAVVLLGSALFSIASSRRGSSSTFGGTEAPATLVPTGEPEDWTDRSAVLAEVPERIDCMVPLPDGESIRFVWGRPRQAEDLNIRTGRRTPSPLVADAYAEGCPDTTHDGRVVFTGYTDEGSPFAFVSGYPDGRGATPVVSIAQPSFLSDPVWFPDGDRFQYQIDDTHAAIYSVSTKQTTVLATSSATYFTAFEGITAGRSVLLPMSFDFTTEVQVFSSPFVGPDIRFRVPFFVTHVESPDGRLFLMAASNRSDSPLLLVDAVARRARSIARIDGQTVRQPLLLAGALAFSTAKLNATLVVKGHQEVAVAPELKLATRCGPDILAVSLLTTNRSLVRLDEGGRELGDLKVHGDPSIPQCAPDGRILYFLSDQNEVRRCEAGECSTIAKDVFAYSLSPDGNRLAVFATKNPPLGLRVVDARGTWRSRLLLGRANPCRPSWQTDDLLWVSVRKGRSLVWEQLAVPSGTPTGRTMVGQFDCADGREDPATPFPPEVRIVDRLQYQVRLVRHVPGMDLFSASQDHPRSERQ